MRDSMHFLNIPANSTSVQQFSRNDQYAKSKSTCSGDGIPDPVNVLVTGNTGTNYAIVLTDAFDKIQKIVNGKSFDMEGWSSNVYNVRGISYENGIVNLQVGKFLSQLAGCFSISNTGFTVTISNKEAGTISTTGNKTDHRRLRE
jgi:hypothetical protein